MRSFRSVVFRLFKAEADGCSVSRLTRCTSYYHPRQPVLRQVVAGGPRTSNRQTVDKTYWSSTERRLSSTALGPHSGHRVPLHTPTNVPNAFFLFCTVNTPAKKNKNSVRGPGIEPGSTAWKAAMLTITPATLYMMSNSARLTQSVE